MIFCFYTSVQLLSCGWLLWPYGLQHARLPCPSPTPRVHSDSRLMPSSHLILCRPLLLLPPILPASGPFPKSQLFAWGGQSTGVSALASFLPKKSQGWSPCSPRDSQESSPPQFKSINSSALSFLYGPTLSLSLHFCFVGKVMSLLFNMLSRLIIAFLPKNKCLLISWLQLPSAVILEPKKIKSVPVSIVSPSICHEVIDRTPWS